MFMKIKNLWKFSRAYLQVNKFLGQYKDRALMIRVTPAQAQLLIHCTKLGILNPDDLNKAIGKEKYGG